MIEAIIKDKKELDFLTERLRKAAQSPAALDLIRSIAAELNLSIEEEERLADIIGSILRGEVEMSDCATLFSSVLDIDFEKAMEINSRLYENLFFDIEDDLAGQFTAYQARKKPESAPAVAEEDIKKAKAEKSEHAELIARAIKKFSLFAVPPSVIPAPPRDPTSYSSPVSVPEVGSPKVSAPSRVIPAPSRVIPAEAGIQSEDFKKRFAEAAESFLSGARTKAQFRNTLMKEAADGGVGMAQKLADEAAEFLASYVRIQDIKTEKPKNIETKSPPAPLLQRGEKEKIPPLTPPLITRGEKKTMLPPLEKEGGGGFLKSSIKNQKSEIPPSRPAPSSVIPVPSRVIPAPSSVIPAKAGIQSFPVVIPAKAGIQSAKGKIEIDFSREEKEAAKQKSKIEKIKTQAPKLLSVTEGVKKALEELNYTYPSSELQERLKTIIDSRARNVRTAMQTFEMLIAPTRSGGMGFAKAEADKVSLVLNKYLEEKSKDIYESKLAEIKAAEGEEKKKQEEREQQKNAERQKVLDAKYTKLTEGKKIPPSPPFLKGREKTAGSLPLEKGEAVRVTPVSPSITPTPPSVIPAPSRVIPAKAGIQPRPPLNQQFSPPPRPSLEDINFTPKLFGPVEEIGQMTLSDFRKLSGDTKERLQKIQDKLNLLREESYIKYRAGLAAWKKSPVYGEYLKIINQAVSGGIGLDDAIRSAGTLTKEEVDGIIESKIGD